MAAASKIEMERRMLMSPFVGTLTLIASTIETRQNVHPLHHTYIVDALLAPADGRWRPVYRHRWRKLCGSPDDGRPACRAEMLAASEDRQT
jgi:hypothetical protein